MSVSRPTEPSLSPTSALRIDGLCDRFEAEWAAGHRPRIEDQLAGLDLADRPAALRELLRLELALRVASGETPRHDEYRSRFPDESTEVDAVFALDKQGTAPHGRASSGPEPTARDRQPIGLLSPPPPAPDGYEILELLGRGGMGVVYRAHQVRLKRDVALKMVLAGEHAAPEAIARFLAEAEAIAKLRHPNVVQIFDLGDHDGRPYFAMEYLARGSLARQLDGTPRPSREAAAMVEQIARGVAEAHRLGIVHRDLKPANILIADDGAPRVADFGLAKTLGTDSGLTRSDLVVGTPSYMSPEQASGSPGGVGPEADVHALGAMLYEVLTGRPPFRGATAIETVMQVRSIDPVPPRRLVPGIARDIETIALRCLQKDPSRRYASAEALADDLRRFLDDRTIVARPTAWPERAWKWARRRPGAATAILAAALALITILSLGAAYNARLSAALGRATLAERAAEANARDAARQRNLALRALNDLVYGVQDRLGQDPATRPLKQALLDGAIVNLRELAREAEGGAPDLSRADAHVRLGDLFVQVGRVPEALEQYQQATTLSERLLATRPNDPDVLSTLAGGYTRTGERLTAENRPEDAVPILNRAVDLAMRRSEIAPSDAAAQLTSDALRFLTQAHLWRRRLEEARETVERMCVLARSWVDRSPDNPLGLAALADAQVLKADVMDFAGEPSRELLEAAVATMRRVVALDPSNRKYRDDLLIPLSHLSDLAFGEGQYEDAARGYEEAIGVLTRAVAEDPERLDIQLKLIDQQYNLAACERNQGRYNESSFHLRPAVERLRSLKSEGRLRGLAVYDVERLPVFEADLAFCEAAPRGLIDREFACSQPPAIASRLLVYRLREAAAGGRTSDVIADAEAMLTLDSSDAQELFAMARARIACLAFLEPGSDLAERTATAAVDALSRAIELGFEADLETLRRNPFYEPVRSRQDYQVMLERIGDTKSSP